MAVRFDVDDIPDQSGRVAVVTGASSGLGAVLTEVLAARGATVLMAVRDPAKAARVRAGLSGDIEIHQVDLADLDSVRRFAATLHDGGRGIDVLVNNAGIAAQTRQLSRQGHELVFATNQLGAFALTGLLLDLFRPDHDPRVVAVGSNLYRRVRPDTNFTDLAAQQSFSPGGAYVKSKLANILTALELQRRLRQAGSPVRSFVAHPGMARTPMQDTTEGFTQKALLRVAGALIGRSAAAGALPLLFAATSPQARPGAFLGPSIRKWDRRIHPADLVAPADDPALAAQLWRICEDATDVHYLDPAPLPGTSTLEGGTQ